MANIIRFPLLESGATQDWRPKGEYQQNYFKVLPALDPIPASKAKCASPRHNATLTTSAPIPDVNIGDDVVVVQCLVQSDADKRTVGIWRAMEHFSTKPLCFVFKIGKLLVVWTSTPIPGGIIPLGTVVFSGPCPAPITDAIVRGATFLCHSLAVDRQMYRRLGWPEPMQWNEMAAILAANNYHRAIDRSADAILGCTQAAADRRILRSFWARKNHSLSNDELKSVIELSVRRVHLIAAMAAVLGHQPGVDEDVRLLNDKMNSDGVRVDTDLVQACISIREKLSQELAKHANEIIVRLPEKPKRYEAALKILGFQVLNEKIKTLTQALEKAVQADNLHAQVLLVTLLAAQQTTASKFTKILKTTCSDGFLRGLYIYQQARTGRWTSEDVQMHNMKKTILDAEEIKNLIVAVKSGSVDAVLECIPLEKAHDAISGLIRAVFIPREGYRFVIADFKAIEPRVLLWLAGDMKLLKIFIGCDFYLAFSELIFGPTPPNHPDYEFRRAIGKLAVLGCLYGMGADTFKKYCLGFGIDLKAKSMDAKKIVDLFKRVFVSVKRLWYGYQDAAFAAIRTKRPVTCGRVVFSMVGTDLHLTLPSRRIIIYHDAKIVDGLYGKVLGYTHHKAKGKPEEIQAWGGKITENICQAVARDVLAEGMVRVQKVGYKITLHTHDEAVTEVLIDKLQTETPEIERLLEQSPVWAPDLPLKLEIFESDRYGEESIV